MFTYSYAGVQSWGPSPRCDEKGSSGDLANGCAIKLFTLENVASYVQRYCKYFVDDHLVGLSEAQKTSSCFSHRCVYPVCFRLARPYVHVESVSVPLEKLGVTGSLLCQWEKALGGIVIGTISTKEKAAQAKEDGCHHVIINKRRNFAERVTKITSG
ncbi:GroES-like zinc-binding alcohol dehydrogenase family protein [Tanacetum coccineum]